MTDHGIKIGRCYTACKRCGKPLHYGDCAMTDPAQERELIEGLCEKRPLSKLALDKVEALGRLSGDSPWLVNPLGEQAADALLSRIAEVGRLRTELDEIKASMTYRHSLIGRTQAEVAELRALLSEIVETIEL